MIIVIIVIITITIVIEVVVVVVVVVGHARFLPWLRRGAGSVFCNFSQK